MKFLFWLALSIILYHFLIYPLFILFLARIRPRPIKKKDFFPFVSIVIPVYNEERIVDDKIQNTLQVDYPKEKLEIVFASDGSTDRTCEIIRKYFDSGITLIDNPEHLGKTGLLNLVIPKRKSEIIVFTDASGMLNKVAIKEMMKNFYDPGVGCVCGIYHLHWQNKRQADRFEEKYLDLETILKKNEGLIYTTLGGPGALYAIRKSLFKTLKNDLINEDFLISSYIVLGGHRIVYEEKALVFDKIETSAKDEFKRRIRISAGNWQQMFLLKEFLKTKKYFIAWQFISRKAIRIFLPFLLTLIFISSVFLDSLIYRITFWIFLIVFGLAINGYLSRKKITGYSVLYIPFFIFLSNLASLVGAYKFFFTKKIKW